VQSQLSFSVTTLTDFNALAQLTHGGGGDTNASRTAAIWRTLPQYPSASIWVEEHRVLSSGQMPPGDRAAMIMVEERRGPAPQRMATRPSGRSGRSRGSGRNGRNGRSDACETAGTGRRERIDWSGFGDKVTLRILHPQTPQLREHLG
jgi:hypothetical protein